MNASIERKRSNPSRWHQEEMIDYSIVESRLPVLEETITQVRPGKFSINVEIVSANDITFARVQHNVLSVGTTILNPNYFAFLIPFSINEECKINGTVVTSSTFYLPGSQTGFHIRGGGRDILGLVIRRNQLVKTFAALRGTRPEEIILSQPTFNLPNYVASQLRYRLNLILEDIFSDNIQRAPLHQPEDAVNEALRLITDAYLCADPAANKEHNSRLSPERIVRLAEERFLEANGKKISLADLCAAAKVSKSVLYRSFEEICGLSPLNYFRKRQLTRARSIIIESAAKPGAIKKAAFAVGLTELGRFSAEYRQLFGETPSTTLNSSLKDVDSSVDAPRDASDF